MQKSFKFKLNQLLNSKILIFLIILYFVILNFQMLCSSGLLSQGSRNFNAILKYTLLVNNFTLVSEICGLLLAIFIGTGLIGKDIETGQLYVILTSSPKRYKYLLGSWLALTSFIAGFLFLIAVNFYIDASIFEVNVVTSDLLRIIKDIFLNMTVIMTVTAVFSVFLRGYLSAVAGLAGLFLFNIYTYSTIPFTNQHIMFTDCKIQNYLCNICPIADVSAPSIVGKDVVAAYTRCPIIPNISIYQLVYIAVLLLIGILAFKRKDI